MEPELKRAAAAIFRNIAHDWDPLPGDDKDKLGDKEEETYRAISDGASAHLDVLVGMINCWETAQEVYGKERGRL